MRSQQPFCTWCSGTARRDPPRELTRISHRRKDNYRGSSLGLLWEADGSKGRRLTVSLSGRARAHPARRERKIAKRARGAPPPTPHGPLQARVRRLSKSFQSPCSTSKPLCFRRSTTFNCHWYGGASGGTRLRRTTLSMVLFPFPFGTVIAGSAPAFSISYTSSYLWFTAASTNGVSPRWS